MASCRISKRRIYEKLPFDIVDFKETDNNKTDFFTTDFVFVGPKRYVLPVLYKEYGLDIYNFEARPDDIYLVGYPRSGTTLHCEMVWQIGNDLDFEGAAKDFIDYRFPHIDFCMMRVLENTKEILDRGDASEENLEIARKYQEVTLEGLAQRKGRRFIKSHLPLSLMPPHIFEVGAKVIYCARNPKDALVSLSRISNAFKCNRPNNGFKDFYHDFIKDLTWNSPYFEHVKEAWERRNDKNVLFLFYEDTIKDKRRTINKVADFMGKHLTADQVDSLEDYLNIDKFKNNKSVNCDPLAKLELFDGDSKFIRKGKSGGWRDFFDEEMEKEFDQMMKERLKGTDVVFPET